MKELNRENREVELPNIPNILQDIRVKPVKGQAATPRKLKFETIFYFTLWFVLNIVLTVVSKLLLSKGSFPYPMLMTAVHMLFTYLGAEALTLAGTSERQKITRKNFLPVLWFSLVFTINIWLSNASLHLVDIDLHQIVRTTIPFFTMGIQLICFGQKSPLSVIPSVFLVVVGVAMSMWHSVEVSAIGLLALMTGCVFSSLKGILTQRTQTGSLGFSTIQILRVVCPLAIIELLALSIATGEAQGAAVETHDPFLLARLAFVGFCAFSVNFTSFKCASLLNPLTLNIAGNVKQILTSILGIAFTGGILTVPTVAGASLTGVGAVWYTFERQKETKKGSIAASLSAARDAGEVEEE